MKRSITLLRLVAVPAASLLAVLALGACGTDDPNPGMTGGTGGNSGTGGSASGGRGGSGATGGTSMGGSGGSATGGSGGSGSGGTGGSVDGPPTAWESISPSRSATAGSTKLPRRATCSTYRKEHVVVRMEAVVGHRHVQGQERLPGRDPQGLGRKPQHARRRHHQLADQGGQQDPPLPGDQLRSPHGGADERRHQQLRRRRGGLLESGPRAHRRAAHGHGPDQGLELGRAIHRIQEQLQPGGHAAGGDHVDGPATPTAGSSWRSGCRRP